MIGPTRLGRSCKLQLESKIYAWDTRQRLGDWLIKSELVRVRDGHSSGAGDVRESERNGICLVLVGVARGREQ